MLLIALVSLECKCHRNALIVDRGCPKSSMIAIIGIIFGGRLVRCGTTEIVDAAAFSCGDMLLSTFPD